jgi:signal transduction histidine kinase
MFKALNAQSIASRLFISAAFWSFTILIVAGLGLSAINARSAEAAFDERLGVYLKALVANVATGGEEARNGPAQLIDPQFELAFSGWYWQITRLDAEKPDIRSSRSLFATQLPRLEAADATGPPGETRSGYVQGPGDHTLRMIQREIDAGEEGRFLIQVAANSEVIESQIDSFEVALAATFMALALALLGSTALAVRFGLRPLRDLQEGVAAIRRGEAEHISGAFPHDIAPLAGEVNMLLDANREIVERARTQVGNLAHALKTPLSVILNEADAGSPTLAGKVAEQAEVMRRQVTFYLDRARAAARAGSVGAATEVRPIIDGLVRTFDKVYRDRDLNFSVHIPEGLRFRGEGQDLTDLVGNLLDNAGKWASEKIDVAAWRDPPLEASGRASFVVCIDDDGPGLDAAAREAALVRGQKLDESRPGSGLGLSIVIDLAAIYGGALLLEGSPLGGLRATLKLPSHD